MINYYKKKKIIIIPNIRGINIYNLYKKKYFIKKIKNYINYINNIKILIKYKKKINFNLFKNIKKICLKNNINLTLSIKFYKIKKIYKYIKFIKYIIKKIFFKNIFINIIYQSKNIYFWYKFYKKFFYLFYKNYNINKIFFINYPNYLKYPNNIELFIINKLFNKNIIKKKNILLMISLYKNIYRIKNKIIHILNYMLNKNISIILSEINYINDIEYILNYCQKKNISWWVTPKKNKKIKIKKNNIYNIKSIIFCKNGIRQTSIKI